MEGGLKINPTDCRHRHFATNSPSGEVEGGLQLFAPCGQNYPTNIGDLTGKNAEVGICT